MILRLDGTKAQARVYCDAWKGILLAGGAMQKAVIGSEGLFNCLRANQVIV